MAFKTDSRVGVTTAYRWRQILSNYVFLAPVVALNLIVIVIPSLTSIYISMTKWSGLNQPEFVGLANFGRLINDPIYWKSLSHNVIWTIFFLTIPVFMGLTGAYLLSGIKRFQMVYRVAFFIPYVIASVVNTELWRTLLHPRHGIGAWLAKQGIEGFDIRVFGSKHTALYGVAFVDSWHFWGFLVIVYLAAMYQVQPDLYEVAILEGASRFQRFRYVTVPGIRPTLVFTLLMIMIWSVPAFDYIYLLTDGGPAHASEVLGTYLYNMSFFRFEVGYAASVGVTMALITACIVAIFVILRRRGWEI